MTDDDGRAPNPLFSLRQRVTRDIDELVGLCKGMVADGVVNVEEARFLQAWLTSHRDAQDTWPASVLFPRIAAMLADGSLEDNEERELLGLLIEISGGNPVALGEASLSASLPITKPEPSVAFVGRRFCFTGRFFLGPRKACEKLVVERGGIVEATVSSSLDYLVVGMIASKDWAHSTFGRKIERAVTFQSEGRTIAIVAEPHFTASLCQQN